MEQAYWIGRKRASLKLAQAAVSSEARLAHYELAGRYSVQAIAAERFPTELADVLPPAISANCPNTILQGTDDA